MNNRKNLENTKRTSLVIDWAWLWAPIISLTCFGVLAGFLSLNVQDKVFLLLDLDASDEGKQLAFSSIWQDFTALLSTVAGLSLAAAVGFIFSGRTLQELRVKNRSTEQRLMDIDSRHNIIRYPDDEKNKNTFVNFRNIEIAPKPTSEIYNLLIDDGAEDQKYCVQSFLFTDSFESLLLSEKYMNYFRARSEEPNPPCYHHRVVVTNEPRSPDAILIYARLSDHFGYDTSVVPKELWYGSVWKGIQAGVSKGETAHQVVRLAETQIEIAVRDPHPEGGTKRQWTDSDLNFCCRVESNGQVITFDNEAPDGFDIVDVKHAWAVAYAISQRKLLNMAGKEKRDLDDLFRTNNDPAIEKAIRELLLSTR